MNQFRDSFVGYRQYWVLAQRAALLCRCASAIGFGGQSIHRILLRYEFVPSFQPQTQHPGGLIEVPRRWLRVKRYCAFGELKWHVATCRQTVEA